MCIANCASDSIIYYRRGLLKNAFFYLFFVFKALDGPYFLIRLMLMTYLIRGLKR